MSAENPQSTEAIDSRIANFREIGTAFKGINDELKSPQPYLPAIQESARQIDSLGSEMLSWFPAGTGPAPEPERGIIDTILSWFSAAKAEGKKTRAKPAVWTEWATFEQAQHKFQAEARKLNEVARSGDKAAVTTQLKLLGQTCKGCHDRFREPEDE